MGLDFGLRGKAAVEVTDTNSMPPASDAKNKALWPTAVRINIPGRRRRAGKGALS